jgi:hypothetical protein
VFFSPLRKMRDIPEEGPEEGTEEGLARLDPAKPERSSQI